jgi:threonine synthase
MEKIYSITCVRCGSRFSEEQTVTRCLDCGQALEVCFDFNQLRESINEFVLKSAPPSAMKYLDFYPLAHKSSIVSIGEGGTPLVSAKILGEKYGRSSLFIKNEGTNPTGVFKDRGSLVEISKAKELGAKAIVVASTGNMAASVSAYSARAGIPCYVLIPEGTPIGKLSQTLSYGGKVFSIRGNYGDCVRLSEEMAKKYGYFLAGDYAFRGEGQKSLSYELIEQFSWDVPDAVIIPMGCGTNLAAIAKGFFEYKELGLISRLPKIIGVQAQGANPIVIAFEQQQKEAGYFSSIDTIASAVGIGAPLDDRKALDAIYKTNGVALAVDDHHILLAQRDMSHIASVFTEPSGAIPVAALPELLRRKVISPDDTVVCVATGIGLKDPKSATILFSELPSLDPDIDEIERYLASGIADIKSVSKGNEILFSQIPSRDDLKMALEEEFSFDTQKNQKLFEHITEEVRLFFELRGQIRKSEMQTLLEDSISDFDILENPVLEIVDFSIQSVLHSPSVAKIIIRFQRKEISAEASGTGPVDAVVTAIEKAIAEETDFRIRLLDYNVSIPIGGVHASVTVQVVAEDVLKNKIYTKAASPNILIASLYAYLKAFSRLWKKSQKK